MRTLSTGRATYASKAIQSIFAGRMVENCACVNCEYVGDPLQIRRGLTGTDRRTLSVATGDYLAGRSAGYENQALRTVDVNARRQVVWKFLLFYLDPPARKHSDMFTSLRSIIAIAVATQKHLSYLYKLLAPWQG